MSQLQNITCSNCGTKNEYYYSSCKHCKAFIREKVVNIDLGNSLINIIDSPSETFSKIISSEHKNYITFLLILISIRFAIISRFISVPFAGNETNLDTLTALSIFLIFTISIFFLLSLLLKNIIRTWGITTPRLKDVNSILVYSFLPQLLALIILFPIELVFYGEYLFSNNPYPFDIKESVFYVLLVIELLSFIWTIFLFYTGLSLLVINKIKSLLITLISFSILFFTLYLMSKLYLITYEN